MSLLQLLQAVTFPTKVCHPPPSAPSSAVARPSQSAVSSLQSAVCSLQLGLQFSFLQNLFLSLPHYVVPMYRAAVGRRCRCGSNKPVNIFLWFFLVILQLV